MRGLRRTGLCGDDGNARLRLENRWSARTNESANPEIVSFIPGDDRRALVSAASANRLGELFFDDDRVAFGSLELIDTGNSTSTLTSVTVAPPAWFAAITVSDAGDGDEVCLPGVLPGCACGSVHFVDIRPGEGFRSLADPVDVGYTPDSAAFHGCGPGDDDCLLVTADEDDRRDCKPKERSGGSISGSSGFSVGSRRGRRVEF